MLSVLIPNLRQSFFTLQFGMEIMACHQPSVAVTVTSSCSAARIHLLMCVVMENAVMRQFVRISQRSLAYTRFRN